MNDRKGKLSFLPLRCEGVEMKGKGEKSNLI